MVWLAILNSTANAGGGFKRYRALPGTHVA